MQGEVEQISMMKPKAEGPNDTSLLDYLEDIIGTQSYVQPIEESAKRYSFCPFKFRHGSSEQPLWQDLALCTMHTTVRSCIEDSSCPRACDSGLRLLYQRSLYPETSMQ